MELKTILLGQRPARVWTGGSGEAIVLLHGGWAGQEAYWSTVTDDFERTHLVVVPELPLVHSPEGLTSFGAYATWLAGRTRPRQERCAQDAAVPGAVATRDDPGAGHLPQIERPVELLRALRRYLKRQAGGGALSSI